MHQFDSSKPVYAITDYENHSHDQVLNITESLFKAGINLLQYRNKTSEVDESKRFAISLRQLCSKYNALLIINDNPELVETVNADGLHLGKEDISLVKARELFPNKILGVSCYNNLDLAVESENSGADYIAFGAFFSTTSKTNTVSAPIEIIKKAKSKIKIPLVAIGGITPNNAKPLIENGIDYIAAISGLYGNSDPYSAAKNYLSLFEKS